MFMLNRHLFLVGLAIWLGATIALRFVGEHILPPGHWLATLLLFALGFTLMALLARRLCKASHLPADQWLGGAVSLALPTLLLDPFSSAFFSVVFPNIAPQVAGTFGGWMLICCAGALLGGAFAPSRQPSKT
jgi:Family of unknown function (DUF5367)